SGWGWNASEQPRAWLSSKQGWEMVFSREPSLSAPGHFNQLWKPSLDGRINIPQSLSLRPPRDGVLRIDKDKSVAFTPSPNLCLPGDNTECCQPISVGKEEEQNEE
ncbi:hypothetical protein JOQ06_012762, partial [Pogonophryne albipinna]